MEQSGLHLEKRLISFLMSNAIDTSEVTLTDRASVLDVLLM